MPDSSVEPPFKRVKYGDKVSALTIPDDEVMRRFVQHITNLPSDWRNSSVPACSWIGIVCDAQERAIHFAGFRFHMKGNLTWPYMPRFLQRVIVVRHTISYLRGELLSSNLCNALLDLRLSAHKHTGRFDVTTLPTQTEKLQLDGNDLSGLMDLTLLLITLRVLNLSYNSFEGAADLTQLPRLEDLDLTRNLLSGGVDLTCLPDSLEQLKLSKNAFNGTIELHNLPSNLKILNLGNCRFGGVVNLCSIKKGVKGISLTLLDNNFTAVVYPKPVPKFWIERSVPRMTQNAYEKSLN